MQNAVQNENDPAAYQTTAPRQVMSVLGPVPAADLGITDAHNHLWIEPVPGGAPDAPVLTERGGILAELADYRKAGGRAQLDCQPGGCGRNARVLAELSQISKVTVICSTGFHRRRYYAPDYWLWNATAQQAADYFTAELCQGTEETRGLPQPVRAGFIKVACEATLAETPRAALEGAAQAAAATGAAIAIHTEKGASAAEILSFMTGRGVAARQVVLCHMDKRPDFGLHRDLVEAGALLEYDTFYRPKYDPDRNVWPLIGMMLAAGLEHGIALATDMAEAAMWARLGGGPGLVGLIKLVHAIGPRMKNTGLSNFAADRLLGGNIIARLAH